MVEQFFIVFQAKIHQRLGDNFRQFKNRLPDNIFAAASQNFFRKGRVAVYEYTFSISKKCRIGDGFDQSGQDLVRIAAEFADVFAGGIDLLFTPTTPTTAFKAGEKLSNPVAMYQSDVFVCPANLAKVPAVSLPIGKVNGLPVGGQLIGPRFGEATMLGAAHLLEGRLDSTREF